MVALGKGFVTAAHGQVHYRHCGRGPLLVMLHDSARSSLQHAANMEWLGEHFTVVAPDLPGYGVSTPLPVGQRTVPDYAAALAATLAALGVERCLLYGNHAGAAIALHFAAHHPARVALVVLDGLDLHVPHAGSDASGQALAGPVPCDDGSHLAAAWTGLRDAARHWPARQPPSPKRPAVALPDDASLHESAVDLFMADQSSTEAQLAAQRFDVHAALAQLHVPALLLDRQDDARGRQVDPLPPLPATCRVVTVAPGAMAWRAQLLGLLRSAQLVGTGWQAPTTDQTAPGEWQRYVELLHGIVRVRLWNDPAREPPVLLLHDCPGGSASMRELAADLARTRSVIAPDLPGLGESQPLPYPSLGSYVSTLAEMLEALGVKSLDVAAEGLGATFAIALAAHHPGHVRRLVLDGVTMVRSRERRRIAQHYCPPAAPDRHGVYLQRLWHQLRDAELSWPWFERTAAAARGPAAGLDAHRRQGQLVDVMKQLPSYGDAARAALEASVRDLLPSVPQPVLLLDVAGDVRYASTARAARRLASARVLPRPTAATERAELARAFLA
jgi:pimeloyl-ACP methyl ester carboxylesterase